VLAPIAGDAAERIHALQRRYDPKLAAMYPPHITLAGSSGIGPIIPGTPPETIRSALAAVARATPPISLAFGPPHQFMQTNIVSLPLDAHGPIRELHDRIARSGLRFFPARYTFTPHVTLNFFPELSRDAIRELLRVRVPEPAIINSLVVSQTDSPHPPRILLELPLHGAALSGAPSPAV
jgi:2'-5' RNA ligase